VPHDTKSATVGIVSPGAMGSAVGAALVRGGARVVVSLAGRSARTQRLAEAAGLPILPSLEEVVGEADVVVSIAPPEAARAIAAELARAASSTEARPLVADLNAIAPATARAIRDELAAAGLDLVDGSISGPPPWKPGTRVYLSGERADEVAHLPFDGVERIVVGAEVGAASAVKMSTASVYKGTSALLAHALLAAHANGVLLHVLDDLRAGSPELVRSVERRLASAASKSDRYVGEMREIATTQEAAGLTPALFEAMAQVYTALATSDLARSAPEEIPADLVLEDILERLRKR
jgi:3-hydroxyisobutyrate dehydrogenase-like beta-hydroxyacid dehydrogenase